MTYTDSPQIKALKERYKASLNDKIELIHQQIESLLSSGGDSASIIETHEVLHKLAGSSGMYGYEDVSALCRGVMAKLNDSDVDGSVSAMRQVVDLLEQHR